jgi:hypothetical protein
LDREAPLFLFHRRPKFCRPRFITSDARVSCLQMRASPGTYVPGDTVDWALSTGAYSIIGNRSGFNRRCVQSTSTTDAIQAVPARKTFGYPGCVSTSTTDAIQAVAPRKTLDYRRLRLASRGQRTLCLFDTTCALDIWKSKLKSS